MATGLIGIWMQYDLGCASFGCVTRAAVCILCVIIVLRAARTVPTSVRVKPQVVK